MYLYHSVVCILIFSCVYYFAAKWYGSEKDKRNFRSYEDVLYYTTITHFTVGFGDIAPESPMLRRLTILHVITSFFILKETLAWRSK